MIGGRRREATSWRAGGARRVGGTGLGGEIEAIVCLIANENR